MDYDADSSMIRLAQEIAQDGAVSARLPEAGEFGRIADLLTEEIKRLEAMEAAQ